MVAIPIGFEAPSGTPPQVSGHHRVGASAWLDREALVELVTAPAHSVAERAGMSITPGQERAAMRVVMQAAARLGAVDHDPPPGTLAFSRAMSHERERLRLELRSRHAATLSSLLHTLRAAVQTGGAQAMA